MIPDWSPAHQPNTVSHGSHSWLSWGHFKAPDPTNGSNQDDTHLCKAILYSEIRDTSIRIWDFMIFVPNMIFLFYLLWRFKVSRERVRQLNTFPILRNFYIFIYLCVSVSMMRCFVSVVMKVHTTGGDLTDKIFWVIVRFFLLSTEISVLVFGLFSGHLDVRASIRRILWITLLVSLVYSVCQGSFEIIAPDASFYILSKDYYLYGHGGMIFWFCTCLLSFMVYLMVVLLPWTPCRNRLLLPTKQSFYMYAGVLSFLNLIQAIGALMFYLNQIVGLCIVDATTYLYFTLFTPLVYFTFLSPFLAVGGSNSAASALVTTTAGSESNLARNAGGGGGGGGAQAAPALNRPTNLFTSGLRGAVNFSYRPQVDDDDLLDGDDDFASSVGSGFGGGSGGGVGSGGGLHFDHYGPYAYNQPRSGYLVYGGGGTPGGATMTRNISSFSFQSPTTPMVGGGATPAAEQDSKISSNMMHHHHHHHQGAQQNTKSDHLLESHMLQEQQQQQNQSTPLNPINPMFNQPVQQQQHNQQDVPLDDHSIMTTTTNDATFSDTRFYS